MKIGMLETGEEIHRYKKSIVISFGGKRRVLSTAPHNGGYRENLSAVFNHDGGNTCEIKAPTYAEHMALIAEEIGLDSKYAAGISTAAHMENAAIRTETWEDITVTAVVTGGIEVNGGRVGDPASWHEVAGKAVWKDLKPGTINIMLFFNTDLSEGALARALVTCTEAKTAALQELAASSRYSMGLATGSGTDSTILAANMESSIVLTNAGKHSKLGELIGKAVKEAVKEAVKLQTNLCPQRQHHVLRRMERFGITGDFLWSAYTGNRSRAWFETVLEDLLGKDELVTYTALYAHLLDELMWGLLSERETNLAGTVLREKMGMKTEEEIRMELHWQLPDFPAGSAAVEESMQKMLYAYAAGLMQLIEQEETHDHI